MVRSAFACTADMCIISFQDFLVLDNRARINQPFTLGKKWKWRLQNEQMSPVLQKRILRLTELYGRLPKGPANA